jgi:V/A-type H+-transporting ATPase subunit A
MPAEEGYPAYLAARIAAFYERAGRVQCCGSPARDGALSIIGAVSPPGGDLSDSVVQATLHVVKVFWSLKGELAYQRHFPAIDWLTSYSFYKQYLKGCFEDKDRGLDMEQLAVEAMGILEQEAELREIVRLVGAEALSPRDRLTLETARSIREDFLHQNAFHKVDTHTSIDKQYEMLKTILYFHKQALAAIEAGVEAGDIFKLSVREEIARTKYIPQSEIARIPQIRQKIDEQIRQIHASTAAARSPG